MNEQTKLAWLKRILLVKVLVTFLAWGLPAMFGNEWFLGLFNLSMPMDPIYLRLFGSVVTAFGVAYWLAYRDPVKNRAIIQAGIIDNGLITLMIVYLALTTGVESWFIFVSAILAGLFCLSFIILMPSKQRGYNKKGEDVYEYYRLSLTNRALKDLHVIYANNYYIFYILLLTQ